jgi:hypothetical protein
LTPQRRISKKEERQKVVLPLFAGAVVVRVCFYKDQMRKTVVFLFPLLLQFTAFTAADATNPGEISPHHARQYKCGVLLLSLSLSSL